MNNIGTVLITGASSGIGYELAQIFALYKYNLILVSRNTEKLVKLSNELMSQHNIKVNIIEQDMSQQGAAKRIFDIITGMHLQVDILINNAGAGKVGLFHEMDMSKDMEVIQLNIVSLSEMTKLFSREMIKRRKGKILNVASTGAFSPGPFIAVYYATKAYVLSFSEAIRNELEPYNISVTTLCPGATKTNFSKSAGKKDMPWAMDAKAVARSAYYGLINNKRIVVPGIGNKVLIKLPRNLVSKINFRSQRRLALEEKQ